MIIYHKKYVDFFTICDAERNSWAESCEKTEKRKGSILF